MAMPSARPTKIRVRPRISGFSVMPPMAARRRCPRRCQRRCRPAGGQGGAHGRARRAAGAAAISASAGAGASSRPPRRQASGGAVDAEQAADGGRQGPRGWSDAGQWPRRGGEHNDRALTVLINSFHALLDALGHQAEALRRATAKAPHIKNATAQIFPGAGSGWRRSSPQADHGQVAKDDHHDAGKRQAPGRRTCRPESALPG